MLLTFAKALKKGEPKIYYVGMVHLILFVVFILLSQIDTRQVLGISTWIKPAKFAIANAIFLLTIGGYLTVTTRGKFRRILSWGFVVCIVIELILIGVQGARATTSHFNFSSVFDGVLYGIMGVAIYFNTLFVLLLLGRFLFQRRSINLSTPVWIAMVAGLALCMFGGYMGQALVDNHAHTVGAPDGGPGIFFLNWSTAYGDLRVAHFFALHGLQAMPLVALVSGRFLDVNKSSIVTILFALAYLTFVFMVWSQANSGEPFISY